MYFFLIKISSLNHFNTYTYKNIFLQPTPNIFNEISFQVYSLIIGFQNATQPCPEQTKWPLHYIYII